MSPGTSTILTATDHAIIESLLYCEDCHAGPRSFALRRKLADTVIVHPDDVAPHVVTLNSRVRFRINGGPPEERILVVRSRDNIPGVTLLAWTSRGLALLGMSAGQKARSMRLDGTHELITVEQVLYQPQANRAQRAAGRFGDNHARNVQPTDMVSANLPSASRRAKHVAFGPGSDDWGPGAA